MWVLARSPEIYQMLPHVVLQKDATLPGCVGQSEAAPLEVDAAVHHHLTEEQRRVPGRSARGIFRGDPRGAPRGTCFGSGHEFEEPGQPLVLWNFLHFGLLGALRAQLAHGERSVSAFTWASLKLAPKLNQAVFTRLFGVMVVVSSVPAGATASGLLRVSLRLNKSWACPWSLQTSSHQNTQAPPAQTFISIGNLFLLYTSRSYRLLCKERKKTPQTLTFMYSLCLPPSLLHALFTLLLSLPSLQLNMDI